MRVPAIRQLPVASSCCVFAGEKNLPSVILLQPHHSPKFLSFSITRSAASFYNQFLNVNDAKRKIDIQVRLFAFDCIVLELSLYH
jgi:hypothetical protein